MPSPLSRRRFLGATTGAALSLALVPAPAAFAADEYDTLRAKWRNLLVGTGISGTDPLFAPRLAALGTQAGAYRSSMAPSSAGLWPDLPYNTLKGDPITGTCNRLRTMALAYAQTGTGLTGDAGLAADIVAGLDHIHDGVYSAADPIPHEYWDWWWNVQIGAPQSLLDTCVLVYDHLSAGQIADYCAAVDHFLPDSTEFTGANQVDFCRVRALRGIVGRNPAKLALARDMLSPVFPRVTSGDGFYADGSFLQHNSIPYTGSYGAVLINGVALLFALLSGSSWQITDPARQLMLDAVENSFAPFVYNGAFMDNVMGRGVSRGLSATSTTGMPSSDHSRGQGIMSTILLLGTGAGPAEQARWKGLVKGWLQRDYYLSLEDNANMDVVALSRLLAVRDDPGVTAVAEPVGHRSFNSMDRATHRRPQWAATLSMCSNRTAFYEFGNDENKRGWHTNSGMLAWWRASAVLGQYSDAFWPTVDPYRLPGTTVSRKVLADGEGGSFARPKPTASWAGGTTDGTYGVAGMDIRGLTSTLNGRKSWFFLDDAIVCLGAGIRCTDGTGVESVVDNRHGGVYSTAFTVDGVKQPSTASWSATLAGAGWAHLDGHAGYVFPGGATVKALREDRTGAWRDINGGGSTTPFTRRYLTMWFDHGTDPTGGTYSYVLLPGADAAATAARAADAGRLTVLANTANHQGISVPTLGCTAVNFYGTGTVGTLSSTGPATVMARTSGSTGTLCVANPTRNAASLDITWNRPVSAVISTDPTVTVLSTGSSLQLRIDTSAANGATHKITVSLG
ncbi:polysaccharide lyase 8 family protein [Streptomyces sp. FIT100]|uniref:polysaccharide lyase 8 family protein n=1 Tax=Streptomyces sp. FIT100 TaxID=2837956 RepID=UPI0021CA3426|nr:polysaccharide lyase 8 family protein [Streptomyces sp. FIT100]UUN30624.1 polysaccharide lyase 8 family protein [Streptomyces sp. FIT100]